MPFNKISKGKNAGKYVSPSGKVFTKKQVSLYYATGGFKEAPRKTRKDGK